MPTSARCARTAARPGSRCQAGFTLPELLVVVALVVLLMLGLLEVLERNSNLARRQMEVAELQHSLRTSQQLMSRMVRLAGRGGLPAVLDDGGRRRQLALDVRDNVGADGRGREVVPGLAGGPVAVGGTDILTVRGVLTTSIYQVSPATGTLVLRDRAGRPIQDVASAVSGSVTVASRSPTGRPQSLDDLNTAIDMGFTEALLLVSALDDSVYGVVELDPAASVSGQGVVELAFRIAGGVHPEFRSLYLSGPGREPRLPEALAGAARVGILEEYRFYVRDLASGPVLAMARMFPATEIPHGGDGSAALAIAEHIRQLQVALGYDSDLGEPVRDRDGDGRSDLDDLVLTETADGSGDDWLFNGASDDPWAAPWVPPWDDNPATASIPRQPRLYFVRLSTLGRTPSPLRDFRAPLVPAIENARVAPLNTDQERRHRRQLLRTTIEPRNIS